MIGRVFGVIVSMLKEKSLIVNKAYMIIALTNLPINMIGISRALRAF